QIEDVRRHDARVNTGAARGRRGDTDIELHQTALFRVVRHGIRTDGVFFVNRFQVEEAETFPVTAVFRLNIEIREVDFVRRAFQLYVTTGTEVNVFAFRQLQGQFFNKGGNVRVGNHGGFPLLNAEHLFRNFDDHILLHRHLTGQTPAFTGIAFGEVRFFGRQHRATAFKYLTLTLRRSEEHTSE